MAFQIREMRIDDYEAVVALWKSCEGIGLSEADSRPGIARFLEANPGLCFVAVAEGGELVGAVICGTDGRRGYLHHLAVDAAHRRQGIGEALATSCHAALQRLGIRRCHIFVYENNSGALAFWERAGYFRRSELVLMSRDIPE